MAVSRLREGTEGKRLRGIPRSAGEMGGHRLEKADLGNNFGAWFASYFFVLFLIYLFLYYLFIYLFFIIYLFHFSILFLAQHPKRGECKTKNDNLFNINEAARNSGFRCHRTFPAPISTFPSPRPGAGAELRLPLPAEVSKHSINSDFGRQLRVC